MVNILGKQHIYDWSVIDNKIMTDYFEKYNNIFLLSLNNVNVFGLYRKICPMVNVCCLDNDTDIDFSEKDLLIIDSCDHYNKVCKVITCESLWNELYDMTVSYWKNVVNIKNSWSAFNECEISFEKVIRSFDEGNQAVFITDNNGNFQYTIFQSMTRRKFFFHTCQDNSIYVNFDDNVDMLKKNAVYIFLKYPNISEFPVLKENKIVAMASFCEIRDLTLQWNLIKKDTVMNYFTKESTIALSSDCSDLRGFYDCFKDIFSIDFMNKDKLLSYYSGNFQAMIYGADIWCKALTKGYDVKRIYLDLLVQDVVEWLKSNNISYTYFQMAQENEIIDLSRRWAKGNTLSGSNKEICGYYIQNEAHNGDVFNVIGGRRTTYYQPDEYEHTIYVFGPCIAIGSFAKDSDTIESYLQKIINEYGLKYRVVNCGGGNSPFVVDNDINSLLIMLNTRFVEGDIVIQFGTAIWQNKESVLDICKYSCAEPFNREENRQCCCFVDGVCSHLTKEGNEIIAKYIFEKLGNKLKSNYIKSKEFIMPYYIGSKRIQNNDLKAYLIELEKEKKSFDKIGCIVMNCNPFTLGHYKLVEESSKKVDFLYVFVVEEDDSEIPFLDRYEMAKLNCKDFKNVKVLPSGKFMISSITFADYFNKEALQEKKIIPTMDIQLFAYYIAPTLNIKYRFVGEEPFDRVTAQYNMAMKEVLPLSGIELIEIPRVKVGDTVVCATKVREYLKKHEWDKMSKLLPNKSYEYLKNNFILKTL